jgi:hypothetical protein
MSLVAPRMSIAFLIAGGLGSAASSASADEPPAPGPSAPPTAAEPPASPEPLAGPAAPETPPHPASPYSLPWQLRPAAAGTAIRSDTSFARYEDTLSRHGLTVVSTLLGSYKIPETGAGWRGLAPLVRLAIVNDSPPAPTATGGFAFVNPLVGATYAMEVADDVRAAFFLGATIPVGMGGGDTPDKGALDARSKGSAARMMMDNSLFAVNDFAVIPGVDIAWVRKPVTLQAEATLFQLWRVRGAKAQQEASKTNLTAGVHAGVFIIPLLSLGLDLRYQRWLNAPIAVDKDTTGTLVDNWSAAFGPRFHIPLGGDVKIHPGLAYTRYLDKPNASAAVNYHVIQLDIPVTF